MTVRKRHISTRPRDEPIFTSPTGMDFEKRKITFPPGFIDEIVLKGGDEYVKADDLSTLISAFVLKLEELRKEIVQIKLHLASLSDEDIGEEDVEDAKQVVQVN